MTQTGRKEKILVVDDEEDLLELLRHNLESSGFEVALAVTGEEALASAENATPDFVVLDLMLPGVSGLDVCRRLRSSNGTKGVPILMLTAKGEEQDIVKGLELGADDYVTKPFSVSVLLARIQAILRRSQALRQESDVVKIDDLTLDRARRETRIGDEAVDLTYSEFAIIDVLLSRRGAVMTRQQIVSAIRGGEVAVTDRSIDVHMASIRKKLGELGRRILTVRGVGYRFDI